MALADAATGANNAILQILARKVEEQRYADAQKHQAFNEARQTKGDALDERRTNLQEQEHQAALAEKQQQALIHQGDIENESIPAGTALPTTDPRIGYLRAAGASLTHQDPTLASTQYAGAIEAPSGAGGSMPKPSVIQGTLRVAPKVQPGNPEQYLKGPSQRQTQAATAAANLTADNTRADAAAGETGRHNKAMEEAAKAAAAQRGQGKFTVMQTYSADGKPGPVVRVNADTGEVAPMDVGGAIKPPAALSTVTIQTVDEHGKPVTRVVPKSEAVGQTYARPASAATLARVDSAEAVKQTGDDIIQHLTDPKVAAMIGPAMGRYNTLRDFIGDPPPEMSELAGMIESFALANMGVHGMRSVQGAKKITELLDKRHTPESLAAAIKGLGGFSSHFMENQGRTPSSGSGGKVPMVAPDGRALDVPADKVAEMEAHGATRK